MWNEAQFSETKKFKAQEDKLKHVFEALTLIEHPNIVKFHRYEEKYKVYGYLDKNHLYASFLGTGPTWVELMKKLAKKSNLG